MSQKFPLMPSNRTFDGVWYRRGDNIEAQRYPALPGHLYLFGLGVSVLAGRIEHVSATGAKNVL
jgi:hypothetical protein